MLRSRYCRRDSSGRDSQIQATRAVRLKHADIRLRSKGDHARDSRGTESDLLRVLTHSACRHHPSAAASPWRSVALGAERVLVPSAGEGASSLSAPNALRHFSIQKKRGIDPFDLTSARLPNTVFAKHHGAPWRSAGGVIRQCTAHPRQHRPSDFASKSRAPGGERFRAQALRARECSPQGGRPHVHRDLRE